MAISSPAEFDRGLAPLATLRRQYPRDLWVNERYQDVVQQYGVEGHLRKVTEEYQVLSMQHPDDVMYRYLYARSLMGRNTASSIQQLTEIIRENPDYAAAHGSLAEIYGSEAFRDEAKEKIERSRFLALCPVPAAAFQERPLKLTGASVLVDRAESLLARHADPDQAAAMAEQGIREDEWRLQRIRPFDWYSAAFKRQSQRDLQAKYWRVWAIQVRCQRLAGRAQKADELLTAMEQRTLSLRSASDPVYWDALATLARLYEEGNQRELAVRKLAAMQEDLALHADAQKAAQLVALRKLVGLL